MNFSFFKKQTVTPDLSFIGVDMHSHLLPGIDDGLKTVEETVAYVRDLHTMGYKKLICTPHILYGVHNNTPETVGAALEIARKALKEAEVPVVLEAAAEYMIDDDFERHLRAKHELLTFGDNNILVEMSYMAVSMNLFEVLFELQMRGYKPILAHPERYNFYHRNFERYEELRDRQILFQINLLSLSGYYGKEVKKIGEKLIDEGMVEFIGTDMHHANHLNATKAFIETKEFYDLVKGIPLQNLTLL
jgi:tyrosine-protein phosphatase YwqE